MIRIFQHFLNPDHIPPALGKQLPDKWDNLLVTGFSGGGILYFSSNDPADGFPGYSQHSTDLPDRYPFGM